MELIKKKAYDCSTIYEVSISILFRGFKCLIFKSSVMQPVCFSKLEIFQVIYHGVNYNEDLTVQILFREMEVVILCRRVLALYEKFYSGTTR